MASRLNSSGMHVLVGAVVHREHVGLVEDAAADGPLARPGDDAPGQVAGGPDGEGAIRHAADFVAGHGCVVLGFVARPSVISAVQVGVARLHDPGSGHLPRDAKSTRADSL